MRFRVKLGEQNRYVYARNYADLRRLITDEYKLGDAVYSLSIRIDTNLYNFHDQETFE